MKHDASDYLQYLATSANATYQMLFAWQALRAIAGDYRAFTGYEVSLQTTVSDCFAEPKLVDYHWAVPHETGPF